ncbi:hypothetical protein GCM10027290_48850 [Micromonospora sonneratiae]
MRVTVHADRTAMNTVALSGSTRRTIGPHTTKGRSAVASMLSLSPFLRTLLGADSPVGKPQEAAGGIIRCVAPAA